MPIDVDEEFLLAAKPALSAMAATPKPALHDVESRCKAFRALNTYRNPQLAEGVGLEIYYISTSDGYQLPLYHFIKRAPAEHASKGPAIFHTHGGGLITSSPADMLDYISEKVAATGVQLFSVDYRLAPEFPYPIPLDDCWTALTWMLARADQFHIDTSSVAVMGESAGGNLAAALTLLARERNLRPPLARQILIYPMLDDRNSFKAVGKVPVWDEIDNLTGWTAYLGTEVGKENISPFAAPARVTDVSGLPPLYMDVGQLDLYMVEDLEYASKFILAGIETEFHIYPGVPHGFDGVVPGHTMSKLAKENRLRVLRKLCLRSNVQE